MLAVLREIYKVMYVRFIVSKYVAFQSKTVWR